MNTKEDHHDEINVQLREEWDVSIDEIITINESKDNVDKKEEAAKIKYYEQMYLI